MQGTLYPDVVESGGGAGTANIKSHHNVGGLPDDLQFELVEPLRTLFKDEVRLVGEQLGLPAEIVWRQPFPGPGLGIRIIGEVDQRAARHPARGRRDRPRGADPRRPRPRHLAVPVVLLADVRSVGVQGDGRTYGHPVVLRPVTSEDAMTADWARLPYDVLERISTRITNEVARGQPGGARRDQQAAGHHRVGVGLPRPQERPIAAASARIGHDRRQWVVPAVATEDTRRTVDYSQPAPSPSPSRWRPYPGSPRCTGAAPAARAASQFS